MVDVCDTFCGVETFAAALEMDQMDQMNQSDLEPQKKGLGFIIFIYFYSIITCYNITQLLIHGLEWLFNHASHASDTQASHAITSHAISEWQNGP